MYNRKKPSEELPQSDTAIWSCTGDGCKGWMRDNFTFDDAPTCPICQSPMEQSTRMLPTLENYGDLKAAKAAAKLKGNTDSSSLEG